MKLNYCTLFDNGYASFGVTLITSLLNLSHVNVIFVLPLCSKSKKIISEIFQLEIGKGRIEVLDINGILNANLWVNKWRESTSYSQYCWMLQPLLLQFLTHKGISSVYVDSDLFFFNNPQKDILNKIQKSDFTVVPHHIPAALNRSVSGIYCVQFNYATTTPNSKAIIREWVAEAKKYNKKEPNVYPGQVVLQKIVAKYQNVLVIESEDYGIAPWNISDSKRIEQLDGKEPVFAHFHQCRRLIGNFYYLGNYKLLYHGELNVFHSSYISELTKSVKRLNAFAYYNHFQATGTGYLMTLFTNLDIIQFVRFLNSIVKNRGKNIVRIPLK